MAITTPRPDDTKVLVLCYGSWGNFGHSNAGEPDETVTTHDTYRDAAREYLEYRQDRTEQGLRELDEGVDPDECMARADDNDAAIYETTLGKIRSTGAKVL